MSIKKPQIGAASDEIAARARQHEGGILLDFDREVLEGGIEIHVIDGSAGRQGECLLLRRDHQRSLVGSRVIPALQ